MPTTLTYDEAVAAAAAKLNSNLPAGVPPVPNGYVCVGYGTQELMDIRDSLNLSDFPYAWEGGENRDWCYGTWRGNASHYLYAVDCSVFRQHVRAFVKDFEQGLEPEPEPEPESEPEPLYGPERMTLRVGGVYLNRDGHTQSVVGRNGDSYETAEGRTFTPHGFYYAHSIDERDLVEEVPNPVSRIGITIEEGRYYTSRDGYYLNGPMTAYPPDSCMRCETSGRLFSNDGFHVRNDCYTTHDYDLVKIEPTIPIRFELSKLNSKVFKSETSLLDGYTGWRYLGTHVTKGYTHPWMYVSISNVYGSIKSNGQSMDGMLGHYFEMIPELPQDDSIESRKARASDKAYGKFWAARAEYCHPDVSYGSVSSSQFLNDTINRIARHRTDAGIVCVSASSDPSIATVLQFDPSTRLFTQCQMTWGKVHAGVIDGSDDDSRRDFVHKLDSSLNQSRVSLEWSTVEDTYCTPMYGWNDNDDDDDPSAVTGSCMEKFCNNDGNGHDVFSIYQILEGNGFLKMIKIFLLDKYLGRAICWKSARDNAWIMDRVYCRQERGEIPRDVIAKLAEFAAANGIVARFSKCTVNDLPCVSPRDISCSGLTGHSYYPYLDTYAGVSSSGLCVDSSDCQVVCDNADGEPEEEGNCEVVNRRGWYPVSAASWSEFHDAYVHDDDLASVDGHGYVHEDYVVEDYRGNTILRDEAIGLGPDEDEYAHQDDEDLIEVHVGNSRTTFHAIRA
jgi:hypothetical protein